jgi:hypothetical protein
MKQKHGAMKDNKNKSKINWNFTKEDADEKLSKYYTKN